MNIGLRKIYRYVKHADKTLFLRLVFFFFGYIILIAIIIGDLIDDKIGLTLALIGISIGIFIAYTTRGMFLTHWREDKRKVVMRLDYSALISIILYLTYISTREWLFSKWVDKNNLDAFIFSSVAGAMLQRIIMIISSFERIMQENNITE